MMGLRIVWVLAALVGLSASVQGQPAANSSPGTVRQIKITADKAPDCSTLKTIIESVTRDCKTNDEKAIALYNFMQLTHYHQNYPGEKGGLGALKEINVYGWSLCGGLHTVQAALWREMGWPWRYVGWSNPGHTTVECQYDGKWHYLDVFLRFYAWMPDATAPGGRTIAGEDDLKNNPSLILDAFVHDRPRNVFYQKDNRFENINDKANWRAPCFLNCGDELKDLPAGLRSSNRSGSPTGWAGLVFDSPNYSTDVNLAPGHSLTLQWESIKGAHWWNGRKYTPGHGCGDKDYRNCPSIGPILEPYNRLAGQRRSFSNGILLFAPDFTNDAFLSGLAAKDNVKLVDGKLAPVDPARPASITVELKSPYIMTLAKGQAEGAVKAEVSLDGGKTFKPIKLDDFSEEVGGQYQALVKLSFAEAIRSLKLEAIVQCNLGSLPYLSPGKNKIAVEVADAKELGDREVVVTYAYHTGFRSKSYEELADAGAELARAHYATWSAKPTVVQKTFRAKDLPATFEIDIPTPAGKYPVYPRMVFLRREVVPQGTKPLALPEGAEAPVASPASELKSLPSPFTVGFAAAPARVVRPTSLRTIPLKMSHAVSTKGESQENHYLKWKDGDMWAILVGGDLPALPAAKEIAAARLVVPVTRAHIKAPTKIAVTMPTAAIVKDSPFDFKNIGEIVGTGVIPKQPSEAEYSPAKTFAVDITRAVKLIAAGDSKFRGFALRVVPDRSVDDGWTTRLDLPREAVMQLELDVYDKK